MACRPVATSTTRHTTMRKNNHKGSKAWRTRRERHLGGRVQQVARTRYTRCFLFLYFFSNYIIAYNYHSQPPENEPLCSFSGGMTSHWQLQPPKTSICGEVDPSLTTTTPPPTPKTSTTARFWGLDLPLASTTTHTSQKRARPLVFGRWAFLLPAPPLTLS